MKRIWGSNPLSCRPATLGERGNENTTPFYFTYILYHISHMLSSPLTSDQLFSKREILPLELSELLTTSPRHTSCRYVKFSQIVKNVAGGC